MTTRKKRRRKPYQGPVPEPRKGARKHLSLDEWRLLLAQARSAGLQDHALVRMLYETGMRASEPGELRLDHLKRLDKDQLYVPRGKGSVSGWVSISHDLADLLESWVSEVYGLEERGIPVSEAARKWPKIYVFPGARLRGKRRGGVHRRTVWRTVKNLCEQAGIDDEVAHPHAIKHARVQHLFEEAERQGLPAEAALKTAAKIVGHQTAITSFEHYVAETGRGKKVAEEVLRKAMEE